MLLPSALGFSPHLPVSVYGTGTYCSIAAFPGSQGQRLRYYCFAPRHGFGLCGDLGHTPSPLAPVSSFPAPPSFLRPRSSDSMQCRNFNLLSIAYASRPRLRSRLPQSRSALLWKPRIFGLEDSHLHLATHSGILSSCRSTCPSGHASPLQECSSTKSFRISMASVSCFSPGHFRRRTSRLVSYYALFEWMAASEPTS